MRRRITLRIPGLPEREEKLLPCEQVEEISEAAALRLLKDERYWLQEMRNGCRRRIIKRDNVIFALNKSNRLVGLPRPLAEELVRLPLHSFDIDGVLQGNNLLVAYDLLDCDMDISFLRYEQRFA